jgi:hypothetical protein
MMTPLLFMILTSIPTTPDQETQQRHTHTNMDIYLTFSVLLVNVLISLSFIPSSY